MSRSLDEVARVIYDTSVAKARGEGAVVADWTALRPTDTMRRTPLMLAAGLLAAFPELGGGHPEGQDAALLELGEVES